MSNAVEEGSTSAISLQHSLVETEIAEMPGKSPKTSGKKRKRTSFPCPKKISEKVRGDINNLLQSVPQVDELFKVIDKIGEGTFSSVYRAVLKQYPDSSQEFALKHIIPTYHPDRILSELSCLVKIGGCDNVMGVKLTLRDKDNIVIVMPHFRHDRFQDFYQDMSVEEVREYMRNLFIALHRVHKFNVIHRDVKPGNFLYNRLTKQYALVDFGLAQGVPSKSKLKASSKSTVEGVLHEDTPRISQLRKNTRRTASVSENKVVEKNGPKRTLSESSRGPAPRLAELDPNTFCHSTEKSFRDRRHRLISITEEDPKRSEATTQARQGSENVQDAHQTREKSTPKPMVLTRKGASLALKGVGKRAGPEPASPETCCCYGLPQVCDICLARRNQVAPRAGTPGFRSPEVLLKSPDQTTAVDMWAAGVIFLSILSGRYPFFRAPDDITALAQIMSIMGSEETKEAARAIGKHLQCSVKLVAMDLKSMCRQLRHGTTEHRQKSRRRSNGEASKRRRSGGASNGNVGSPPKDGLVCGSISMESESPPGVKEEEERDQFPDSAYHLLSRLLELDPRRRITAAEALKHPFLMEAS
ncbi:cell division cycle 7-related protein kinase-like [Diadema antillarum]|uniref:cell division cycle 7-related protein kinase-like n=1 Tax=Diadema antillarum TaxID=105358 RepID=UPI003A864E8A